MDELKLIIEKARSMNATEVKIRINGQGCKAITSSGDNVINESNSFGINFFSSVTLYINNQTEIQPGSSIEIESNTQKEMAEEYVKARFNLEFMPVKKDTTKKYDGYLGFLTITEFL